MAASEQVPSAKVCTRFKAQRGTCNTGERESNHITISTTRQNRRIPSHDLQKRSSTHGDVLKLILVAHRELLIGGKIVRRLLVPRRDFLRVFDLLCQERTCEKGGGINLCCDRGGHHCAAKLRQDKPLLRAITRSPALFLFPDLPQI